MCGYQVLASGVGIRGGHQVWASSFFQQSQVEASDLLAGENL